MYVAPFKLKDALQCGHPVIISAGEQPSWVGPYLADKLSLLVHADVESRLRALDPHTAAKRVRLHDELSCGKKQRKISLLC